MHVAQLEARLEFDLGRCGLGAVVAQRLRLAAHDGQSAQLGVGARAAPHHHEDGTASDSDGNGKHGAGLKVIKPLAHAVEVHALLALVCHRVRELVRQPLAFLQRHKCRVDCGFVV
eukprot:3974131-Prymnesium_polylepis.1